MSRKRSKTQRPVTPDAQFKSPVVTKFVNSMMWDGKRTISEGIFYGAMSVISRRVGKEGFEVFGQAMENVRPVLEVRSRRVGGATYQVPTEVRPIRRDALAIRWLIQGARARGERSMRERLAGEILDASQNRGSAVRKREEAHKMAEANRAFAHYRW